MMVHDNGLVGTWGMWTRESVFQKPSWLHENLPQTHRERNSYKDMSQPVNAC